MALPIAAPEVYFCPMAKSRAKRGCAANTLSIRGRPVMLLFKMHFSWRSSGRSQGEIVNILLKIKNSFLPTKQILIGL